MSLYITSWKDRREQRKIKHATGMRSGQHTKFKLEYNPALAYGRFYHVSQMYCCLSQQKFCFRVSYTEVAESTNSLKSELLN